MKSFRASAALAAVLAVALAHPARAQLNWSSYDTSGNQVAASAATFDPAAASYTFTVPAGAARTFVTTNFIPVVVPKTTATVKAVTYSFRASGGLANANPGDRVYNAGIFNYGATAPGATGQFTDDVGLWANVRAGNPWTSGELFGGTSPNANLIGPFNSAQKLGSGAAGSGVATDNELLDLTLRVSASSSGAMSLGSGTGVTAAGLVVVDHVDPTLLTRTIYSSAAATPSAAAAAFTFNEYAFYFYNTTPSPVTLTISAISGLDAPPYFSTVGQPPAVVVGTQGEATTIASEAVGVSLTFLWQKSTDGGANWSTVAGATTATLTLANTQPSDAGLYRVVVTNPAPGGSITSNACSLSVQPAPVLPVITLDPQSKTILKGQSLVLQVQAYGSQTLTYDWQYSLDGVAPFASIPGAASASTYTLSNAQPANTGYYRVVVANSSGSAISAAGLVTVNEAPTFLTPPSGSTVSVGDPVTLSVVCGGTPAPTYQWRQSTDNGLTYTAVPGATSSTYTIPSATAASAGWYVCYVQNAVAPATSPRAYVGVRSATLALTAVTPAAAGTVNTDTPVTLTFNAPVSSGPAGTVRIYDASNDALVDSIDLGANVAGAAPAYLTGVPYVSRIVGGVANFSYYPVLTGGSTATFWPRAPLAYGKTYYVKLDAGVILAADKTTFAGVNDATTIRFTTKPAPTASAAFITVAADGTGDFNTVQAAFDAIPAANTAPVTVSVKDGTYPEILCLLQKHNVTLTGQSRAGTVIQYPNNATLNPLGSPYHRSTVVARYCTGTRITKLTLKNTTPKGGTQAEALVLDGVQTATNLPGSPSQSQGVVYDVSLYSLQDTLQINGQAFVDHSYIEGDVDFLWGTGPCYFTDCEFKLLVYTNNPSGYYTQIRNGPYGHGYVFNGCTFSTGLGPTASTPPNNYGGYLGRTDQTTGGGFPYTEVVLLNCLLDDTNTNAQKTAGDFDIVKAGWQLNGSVSSNNVLCAEYNSLKLDGVTAANVAGRVGFSRQLTAAQAGGTASITLPGGTAVTCNYFNVATVLAGWAPVPAIVAGPAHQTAAIGTPVVFSVTATSAINAPSYQWLLEGVAIPGATAATLNVANASAAAAGSYSVAVTNHAGTVTSAAAFLRNDALSVFVAGFGLDPNGPSGAAGSDPDQDGANNQLEFFLGSNPSLADPGKLPTVSHTTLAGTPVLVFEFDRNTAAASLPFTVEYSTDLAAWTPAQDGVAGVSIVTTPAGAGKDHIAVAIPDPAAPANKLFARLRL